MAWWVHSLKQHIIIHTLGWNYHQTYSGNNIFNKWPVKPGGPWISFKGTCSPQKVKQQAYTTLVRPTLEYAAIVWDPHHQKDINSLEKVQRKAIRFITGNYRRRTSVTALRADVGSNQLYNRDGQQPNCVCSSRLLTTKSPWIYQVIIHSQTYQQCRPGKDTPSTMLWSQQGQTHTGTVSSPAQYQSGTSYHYLWSRYHQPRPSVQRSRKQSTVYNGQTELYTGSATPAAVSN